jgi:hypothetical protein
MSGQQYASLYNSARWRLRVYENIAISLSLRCLKRQTHMTNSFIVVLRAYDLRKSKSMQSIYEGFISMNEEG